MKASSTALHVHLQPIRHLCLQLQRDIHPAWSKGSVPTNRSGKPFVRKPSPKERLCSHVQIRLQSQGCCPYSRTRFPHNKCHSACVVLPIAISADKHVEILGGGGRRSTRATGQYQCHKNIRSKNYSSSGTGVGLVVSMDGFPQVLAVGVPLLVIHESPSTNLNAFANPRSHHLGADQELPLGAHIHTAMEQSPDIIVF